MIPVLDSLIGIIMNKLVDVGIEKIVGILEVESEMKALEGNMKNIRLVLVDAESKKIESNSIALWLAELREVLYDAEDLLDNFADAQRRKCKRVEDILRSFFGRSIRQEACAKRKISTIIQKIISNLSRLTSQTWILTQLASQPNADKKVCRYNGSRITDTCSFQLDSEIVGIDDDVTDLVDRIKGDCEDHSLFAITGMGGIGKTTLARKVYNHDLIQDHFDNNIVWVCVSSNCSGEYLLKEIVRSIDKEKKFFIVLDDIRDSHVWEEFLKKPLHAAAKHSRILITTRKKQVAMKMDAAHTHPMTKMFRSDGWSMLCNIVFEEKDSEDLNELADVGKQIVYKCKGLPLAIKVVGGVLRMTDRTAAAWIRVLSSTTWSKQDLPEDTPPSLLLSYEDLPSHLKRCFLYCSLFPQDFNFHPTKLMYMWIVEGFIQKEEGTRMEESAKEYYNELVTRNLLQVTPDSDGSSKCKMHDLLHSLAIFVSQNQYIYEDSKTFGSSGLIRHRHLRFNVENMNVDLRGKEHVRTLMLSKIHTIPDKLLSGLTRLRVLDLEGIKIERLPEDSVGNMRQLRFLSISAFELHKLPDSVENLENLETLMIASVLTSRSLPKGIGKLRNLRHLLVSDRLQNMPNGLDNLKKLRVLDCFVVNECTSSSTSECTSSSTSRLGVLLRKKSEDCKPNMKELKDLSELTDLSIHHLERVGSKEEAEEAAMEKKTSLKCLTLSCEPPTFTSDENIKKIEEVFEGIKIPKSLTELSIDGFFGKQLPDHITSDHLRQVKSLKLKECKLLEQLPSLGDMPKLETLHISRCPKLKSFGEGLQHATCLKKMTVRDLDELESIENLSSISELEITRNFKLTSVKNLPSLKKMDIKECPALEVVEDVRELSSLSISSDEGMTAQRTWSTNATDSEIVPLEQLPSLGDMPKLETLHIANLSVANFGSNFVGSSKFPKLQEFRLMEMKELLNMFDVEQGTFPCLVNLHISGCPKLKSLGKGLQHATCLKKMTVSDVSELELIENLGSITELEITRNFKLTSVKNLPSLKKMYIEKCPALRVVEDVGERDSLYIISGKKMTFQLTWSPNATNSEIVQPTVTGSENVVKRKRGLQKIGSFLDRIWSKI